MRPLPRGTVQPAREALLRAKGAWYEKNPPAQRKAAEEARAPASFLPAARLAFCWVSAQTGEL